MLALILAVFTMSLSQAESKIKMYYKNEDLVKIIEFYSKVSGQKFVIDAAVRGKISLFLQEPVSVEEAFNQLSSALAVNGYAISKQGDTMVIAAARNIQRDLIEVSTERPSLKPQRLYTWIYNVRHSPADSINREFRIFPSKEGEMSVSVNTNQVIFTDWVSNLNRIGDIMKEIDKPLDPQMAKLVESSKSRIKSLSKETNE
ncbi:MAG: general secretion pathway protein GspD [Bdellovibrionales bacterium]|nr:general secretion pathway protein GspD [Bdellovibrionales bacterium]